MNEMLETEVHRGGHIRSNGIKHVSSQEDLLASLSNEIMSLKREINSMEGKYISLVAYYEGLVKRSLFDRKWLKKKE